VWAVLTDFAAYPDWNPFISRIEGSLEVGRKLTVRLQPPGGRGLTFKPTVQAADPGRHLGWLGHLIVSGGVRRREFALGPTADGRTHLLQREPSAGSWSPCSAGPWRRPRAASTSSTRPSRCASSYAPPTPDP